MEKLESVRKELAAALEGLTERASRNSSDVAQWKTFEEFSKRYRELVSKGLDPDQKRDVIQKFISKVEVGPDSVKIHFIVDENHYRDEVMQRKRQAIPRGRSFTAKTPQATFPGSNTLMIGASGRT